MDNICFGLLVLYQHAIDKVRIKQTKHLVLDVERARDISDQLEEEKMQGTAERLHHKEAISQVGVSSLPRYILSALPYGHGIVSIFGERSFGLFLD